MVAYWNYGHGHNDNKFYEVKILKQPLGNFIRQDLFDVFKNRYSKYMLNYVSFKLRTCVMSSDTYQHQEPVEFETECPEVPNCSGITITPVVLGISNSSLAGVKFTRSSAQDLKGYHILIRNDYTGSAAAPSISVKVLESCDQLSAGLGLTYSKKLYPKSRLPLDTTSTEVTLNNSVSTLLGKNNPDSPLLKYALFLGHDDLLAIANAGNNMYLNVKGLRFTLEMSIGLTFSKFAIEGNYEKGELTTLGKSKAGGAKVVLNPKSTPTNVRSGKGK